MKIPTTAFTTIVAIALAVAASHGVSADDPKAGFGPKPAPQLAEEVRDRIMRSLIKDYGLSSTGKIKVG